MRDGTLEFKIRIGVCAGSIVAMAVRAPRGYGMDSRGCRGRGESAGKSGSGRLFSALCYRGFRGWGERADFFNGARCGTLNAKGGLCGGARKQFCY